MTPSITSFADELYLIKMGKPWKMPSKEEWKQLGKNVGALSVGAALGGGAGYAVRKKLLPKVLSGLSPKQRTALAIGGGAAAGVLSSLAMKHHWKSIDDANKRNS